MAVLTIQGGARLSGTAEVPADKSILHRALIFSALASGQQTISAYSPGLDNQATAQLLQRMGVGIKTIENGFEVQGVGGFSQLKAPAEALDCQNSGTTLRLMAGVGATLENQCLELTGDSSLQKRPMGRLAVIEELGAYLETTEGKAPIKIFGKALSGSQVRLKVASAQLKSALLIAGLACEEPVAVIEPKLSRDHTERMLQSLGCQLERTIDQDQSHRVKLLAHPKILPARNYHVPGDFSSAAFLLGAALATGGEVSVRSGINPSRTGFLMALALMGATVQQSAPKDRGGEPEALLQAKGGFAPPPGEVHIQGALTVACLDELPLILALAAGIPGLRLRLRDAGELRVKESDRLAAMEAVILAFGGQARAFEDGMLVEGRALSGAQVESFSDHRIAMSAAVMALSAKGQSEIHGAECIPVSFPGFIETLRTLGVELGLAAESSLG